MKKHLFTLSLFLVALCAANLRAEDMSEAQYIPDPDYVATYCEAPRTQGALMVINTCKDREDWAACVVDQEDATARLAYLQVCKVRQPDDGDFIPNLRSLPPCECLAKIQKLVPECGADIECEAKEVTPSEPAAPPPANNGKNPDTAVPLPTTSGSGCALGGMAASVDGWSWIAALGFLVPGLIRRRA